MSSPANVSVRIQLITFPGCPNTSAARALIERAVADAGVVAAIEEIDTTAPDTPVLLREWGSPTILLNGEDVGGEKGPTGPGCRLYRDESGRMQRLPAPAILSAALRRAIG